MWCRCLLLSVLVAVSVFQCAVTQDYGDYREKTEEEIAASREKYEAYKLSDSNIAFTSALYKEIIKQQRGNVFFSPLSIHSILTMTSLGAQGTTLAELRTGLSLPDKNTVSVGYKWLMKTLNTLNANDGVTMKVANKIYLNKRYKLREEFKNETKNIFNADAENIDFRSSDSARRSINTWVENQTNKRIKNVITDGMLSSDTAMVLVNAVFFKGTWLTQFDPKETTTKKFYVTPTKPVDVQMMYAASNFHFRIEQDWDAKILSMKYNNDKFSMLIVLPMKRDGLAELETKITPKMLKNLAPDDYMKFNVNVSLPRFKLEESTELNNILKKMGMSSMFSSSANLTEIFSNNGRSLKVSDVVHKSFIEVNEEGAEAAATTVEVTQQLSVPQDNTQTFEADHPFLFVLRHTEVNHILFMGRFLAPASISQL